MMPMRSSAWNWPNAPRIHWLSPNSVTWGLARVTPGAQNSTGTTHGHEGSVRAEDACASPSDYIDQNYIAGTTTLDNTGPLRSPFGGTIVQPVVVAWDEL